MLQRTRHGKAGRSGRPLPPRASTTPTAPDLQPLRARKKRATMHHIQRTAVGMFEARGFDAVTVEQVAAAADVSPSTVYRYFRTKEGLVLRDEYDELVIGTILTRLETEDLATAARVAIEVVADPDFVADFDLALRRTRLWLETPALRTAGYALAAEYAERLAEGMVQARAGTIALDEARVLMSALIWGMLAAIENWWRAGSRGDLDQHMQRALTVLTQPGAMHR